MSTREIKELDVVALTDPEVMNTEEGIYLQVGQVGTVVHMYNPETFIVEFTNRTDGSNIAFLTLQKNQVLPLLFYKVNQETHQPLSTVLDTGGRELSS